MNKRIVLLISPDLYAKLDEQARAEDRAPYQQAVAILRRVLEDSPQAEPKEARE